MGQAITRLLWRLWGRNAENSLFPNHYDGNSEENYRSFGESSKPSFFDLYWRMVQVIIRILRRLLGRGAGKPPSDDQYYPYRYNEVNHAKWSADDPYYIDIGTDTANDQQLPVVFDSVIRTDVDDGKGDGGCHDDAHSSDFNKEKHEALSVDHHRIDPVNNQQAVLDVSLISGDGEVDGGSNDVVGDILVAEAEQQPKGRCLGAYGEWQRILLVGEGDFSFSASLAVAFGDASNMVATSLDSSEFLTGNYKKGVKNVLKLTSRRCKVIHGVDATQMANHPQLLSLKFDCIVYNFPHGPRHDQISQHQALVRGFLANAKKMIEGDGQIHITHKCTKFYEDWDIEMLGSSEGLQLVEKVPFNFKDYPGYHTKFGFGDDGNFNCNPSKLYKFQLVLPKKKRKKRARRKEKK